MTHPDDLQVQALSERTRQVVVVGPLTSARARALLGACGRAWPPAGGELTLELSGCPSVDSAGAATLLDLWREGQRRSVKVALAGVNEPVRATLALLRVDDGSRADPPAPEPFLRALGEGAASLWDTVVLLLVLAADSLWELGATVLAPRRLRWAELVTQMSRIGSQALGTVGLITFLIGLTLAFQSAHQLRQLGAAIFVADLTAVAMFREMGPLMTAILVAGRSGSAIAAEIATMKVSEELDALAVMGIPFVRFLALPRLLALGLTMPLLVVMADLIGIGGGLVVGVGYLDLAVGPYLHNTVEALGPKDLVMSLTKAITFGLGIGLIALHCGMEVRGGAAEVGGATTRSVVMSLFFIIVMDALFSILFYVVL